MKSGGATDFGRSRSEAPMVSDFLVCRKRHLGFLHGVFSEEFSKISGFVSKCKTLQIAGKIKQ
jgi:hypothetical protein